MPARRGRGGSEGAHDEGFELDRTRGYSCDPALSIPGADRALDDIDAATAVTRNGHRISGYPEMWRGQVESYLTRLGLPATSR